MISCGSASTICSVMLTWYIRSMTGMIQLKPGWAKRWYLPSRSTERAPGGADDPHPQQKHDDNGNDGNRQEFVHLSSLFFGRYTCVLWP